VPREGCEVPGGTDLVGGQRDYLGLWDGEQRHRMKKKESGKRMEESEK